mmetsp:Transcript_25474/g.55658  ORF Transcript_25474/g.55658 Transcript_25474/m.55658 type:complete len:220 (+) Transcript_25474:427-1086(+)
MMRKRGHIAESGNKVSRITASCHNLILYAITSSIRKAVLHRVRIQIIGNYRTILVDGSPDAQSPNATKGIGNYVTGLEFLFDGSCTLVAKAGGPVNLAQIKAEGDAMFDQCYVSGVFAGKYFQVVRAKGTVDITDLGNDGTDRWLELLEHNVANETTAGFMMRFEIEMKDVADLLIPRRWWLCLGRQKLLQNPTVSLLLLGDGYREGRSGLNVVESELS